MSALTRKMIHVDENLSTVIGFSEGELVSYTEITKGIHEYIKKKIVINQEMYKSSKDILFVKFK